MRIFCENPDGAEEVLKEGGYIISRVDDNQRTAATLAGAGTKTANQEDLF